MGYKLFVGNLSYSITEQELRDSFSQGGRTVQSVRIAVDRETQRPRGFAFVEMSTEAEADAAIAEWNNKVLAGRTVFVEKAQERAPGAPRPAPRPRPPGEGGEGGDRPGGPGPRPSFGGPRPFSPPPMMPDPTRDNGRRGREKPERKEKRRTSGRPEERERGKWRWDGNDDY